MVLSVIRFNGLRIESERKGIRGIEEKNFDVEVCSKTAIEKGSTSTVC